MARGRKHAAALVMELGGEVAAREASWSGPAGGAPPTKSAAGVRADGGGREPHCGHVDSPGSRLAKLAIEGGEHHVHSECADHVLARKSREPGFQRNGLAMRIR